MPLRRIQYKEEEYIEEYPAPTEYFWIYLQMIQKGKSPKFYYQIV